MRTIEVIRAEFKNVTGHNLPEYKYGSETGLLLNLPENPAPEFYPWSKVEQMDSIDYDDVCWAEGDEYDSEGTPEIDDSAYVCPENEQKLMIDGAWATVDYLASDRYCRELLTSTNNYYDWTSKRKRMVDALWDDFDKDYELSDEEIIEILESRKKEWEETCADYEDPLEWAMFYDSSIAFSDVLDELTGMYSNRYDVNHHITEVISDFLK